ncbi:MAG: hypothetical protein ISQ14_15495 [Verrucomicrobiae bacterium]|jgi:hypothetical protein|nr:hypothetical protein [Verrucomicrobiae bacterium]
MSSKWAEENLQVIRTLMERSAVYRRRLAPLMMLGAAGATLGGFAAAILNIETARHFVSLWGGVAGLVLLGAGQITRGQAIKSGEVFWTAPTRRIFDAFLPVFLTGGVLGAAYFVGPESRAVASRQLLVVCWCVLYGLGLHSAGFYVAKGIRRLGWGFVLVGISLAFLILRAGDNGLQVSPSFLMASVFGGLHLLSAVYLYFTEEKEAVL